MMQIIRCSVSRWSKQLIGNRRKAHKRYRNRCHKRSGNRSWAHRHFHTHSHRHTNGDGKRSERESCSSGHPGGSSASHNRCCSSRWRSRCHIRTKARKRFHSRCHKHSGNHRRAHRHCHRSHCRNRFHRDPGNRRTVRSRNFHRSSGYVHSSAGERTNRERGTSWRHGANRNQCCSSHWRNRCHSHTKARMRCRIRCHKQKHSRSWAHNTERLLWPRRRGQTGQRPTAPERKNRVIIRRAPCT